MSDKAFLRALRGETVSPAPIWLMRQAGRYLPEYRKTRTEADGFLNLCYSPDLATEVTLQPLRRYNFDAAILFSDILVIPHALGQHLAFAEGEGPVLTPIRSAEDLNALKPERLHDHLAPVYQTVSNLSAGIPKTTALIGFAGAPWTIATYMVEGRGSKDYTETKKMAYGDPALFERLIDMITEATGDYLIRQIDHGAEAVQLFDSWAGVLPEQHFRRFVIQPAKKLVERIRRERPGVPFIGFPRLGGLMLEEFVHETGVDAVSLDTTVPMAHAKHLQKSVTVQGNLDPIFLIAGGQALDDAIDYILRNLAGGRFVFNLGHGILPQTPPENVARLIERVRSFGG